jgi:hypothetical protein
MRRRFASTSRSLSIADSPSSDTLSAPFITLSNLVPQRPLCPSASCFRPPLIRNFEPRGLRRRCTHRENLFFSYHEQQAKVPRTSSSSNFCVACSIAAIRPYVARAASQMNSSSSRDGRNGGTVSR